VREAHVRAPGKLGDGGRAGDRERDERADVALPQAAGLFENGRQLAATLLERNRQLRQQRSQPGNVDADVGRRRNNKILKKP
jgi:hypothetical protein